jgi:hypothetical protein
MRRILFLIGGLLLIALPAFGQGGFTTISGTITDPTGIPWVGGTISAQLITFGGAAPTLNGVGFTTVFSPVPLSSSGSFSFRVADSGVILPANTQWQFTVNTTGVLPPFGKGPQAFTVTTPINCSTNTPAACAANAMTITAALVPVPALTFGSGGIPGGANGQVQFNNSGVFGGITGSVASNSATLLTLTGNAAQANAVIISANNSGQQNVLVLNGANSNGQPVLTINTNFGTEGPAIATTNCNVNSASPAACGGAPSGSVVVPTTTTSYTVNTTAVTANSRILLLPISDATGLSGGPTCNLPPTPFIGYQSARVAGTSFTFTLPSTAGTSCWTFWIVN